MVDGAGVKSAAGRERFGGDNTLKTDRSGLVVKEIYRWMEIFTPAPG